jgi:hypothetical protein
MLPNIALWIMDLIYKVYVKHKNVKPKKKEFGLEKGMANLTLVNR